MATTTTEPGNTNETLPYDSPLWGTLPEFSGRALQADIIACAIITWLIALFFVILRFYTRGRLIRVLGPTDWCIIPSLLFSGGVSISYIEQAVRGAGTHFWQLELEQIPLISRASWYGVLFYSLSLTFTKISILLLYRRIFTYSWAKRASQIVLVIVLIIGAWLTATVFTACVPLEAFWDWQVAVERHAYCHPLNLWWANNGLHLATDILIVMLPMPVLLRLRLPRRQKCALVGLFTLGFFVCIVSIIRLITLIDVETSPIMDPTYAGATLSYWTCVELNTATSCACIMTLKPLIVRVFPKLLPHGSPFRSQPRLEPLSSVCSPHSMDSRATPDILERGDGPPMADRRSRTKSGLLPWMEEGDASLLDDVLEAGEYEARRSDSISIAAPDDDAQHHLDQSGTLRAPPKAHLRRLSIKVTKTVQVTTSPRSPVVDQVEEKE